MAMLKRILDVSLAGMALLIFAPVMIVIAIAIKLDSPGKVVFSQKRLGKDGNIFYLHKFRKFPDSWEDDGPGVTVAGDARMTRVGRFLERSKLDELPQLWNILHGEMTFVGPRPESVRYADLFQGEYSKVHDYVPGIFGPNQIRFRNESEMYPPDRAPDEFYRNVLFPRKAEADIAYFSTSNILTDFVWIARGVWISVVGTINWKRMIALRGPIFVVDLVAIELAWIGANAIRFLGLPDGRHWEIYTAGVWLLPTLLIPLMVLAGCYRYPIRHFSIGDAVRLSVVNVVGWILGALVLLGFVDRGGSVLVGPLGMLLALPMMGLPRLWRRERWRQAIRMSAPKNKISIIVYGAGRRAAPLVSLLDQGFPEVNIVGFLDDNDRDMRGRFIVGRKVLGSERDLETIYSVHSIDQIWVTFEPDNHKYRRLKRWCDSRDVKLVILPLTEPFAQLRESSSSKIRGDIVDETASLDGGVLSQKGHG